MDLSKYQNSKFIFVVGIGGSDLASKAVWNAMTLHKEAGKKIFFFESPDSREYAELESLAQNEINNPEEIALIAISKSGETKETLEAFEKIFDILSQKLGEALPGRTIVVSSPGSPLWQIGKEKGLETLEWQKGVGGRFSAFTVPHTTVLSIAGLEVSDFIAGGKEMAARCEEDGSPALSLANKIFESYQEGADILDFFFFNSELEDLGKWCRQLIAESLGKENKSGERVGLTPTVSIGPTDLHSLLQLNLGGPKNRFTLFVRSLREIDRTVNEPAYENTLAAYDEANLPFSKYEMEEINERELGKFMAYLMETTIELGKLLQIDPYSQPEVEEYKRNLKQ